MNEFEPQRVRFDSDFSLNSTNTFFTRKYDLNNMSNIDKSETCIHDSSFDNNE